MYTLHMYYCTCNACASTIVVIRVHFSVTKNNFRLIMYMACMLIHFNILMIYFQVLDQAVQSPETIRQVSLPSVSAPGVTNSGEWGLVVEDSILPNTDVSTPFLNPFSSLSLSPFSACITYLYVLLFLN